MVKDACLNVQYVHVGMVTKLIHVYCKPRNV